MLKGFRDFIMRGNILDLAVAVVIGAAFKGVIDAFTAGVVSPLVGLVAGQNFDTLTLELTDDVVIYYGAVITQIINFVIVASVLFFLVVKPLNVIAERRQRGEGPEDVPPTEQELLVEIRDLLRAQAQ